MMIVSIDIETTGLDPETCQILEIGAVRSDGETFHCYVDNDIIRGEPYALSMHPKILRRIATKEDGFSYLKPGHVAAVFSAFLSDDLVTIAGKNFAGFDKQFLNRLPGWKECVQFDYRCIDVGNLYWQPDIDGDILPDLKTCMKRVGLSGDVQHTALEDAEVVMHLVQKWRNNDI